MYSTQIKQNKGSKSLEEVGSRVEKDGGAPAWWAGCKVTETFVTEWKVISLELQHICTAPFNNMRTLKFKAQQTDGFFTTVNQMFGSSSQLLSQALFDYPALGSRDGSGLKTGMSRTHDWL